VVQIHADRTASVERPGDTDQNLCEVGKDTPVPRLVGVGQRGARHRAPETHVVELATQGSQTGFDIAQALPVSELRECHGQILVPAGELAQP